MTAAATGILNTLWLPNIPERPTFGEACAEWFSDIIGWYSAPAAP
jgi:hypothetical protein